MSEENQPEKRTPGSLHPVCSATREEMAKKLDAAIWDEIGGYEASHPWMGGATNAVVARVMVILDECGCWPNSVLYQTGADKP